MGKNVFTTVFEVLGKNLASPVFNKVGQDFKNMGAQAQGADAKLRQAGANMSKYFLARDIGAGMLRLGKGIAGAFAGAVRGAADFEFGVASLRGIMRPTAEELDMLATKARQVGIESEFDPTQAIEAFQGLGQKGLNAAQALEAVDSVVNLTAASFGRLGIADSVEIATQAIAAFGVEVGGPLKLAMDQIVRQSTSSGVALDDMNLGLSNIVRGALATRQSLKESLVSFGLVKNAIPRTRLAATALAVSMERLGDPSVQKNLKGLGVNVVDPTTNKFRSFLDVMIDMNQAMSKMSDPKKAAFLKEQFGGEGLKGPLAIFEQLNNGIKTLEGNTLRGAAAVEYLRKNLDNAGGAAEDMAKLKLATLNGQFELLRGSIQTFSIEVGKSFAMLTKGPVDWLITGLNKAIEFLSALSPEAKKIGSAMIALTSVSIGLAGGFVMLRGVLGMFGLRLRDIGFAILKVLAFAAPLTLFFGSIALAVYAVHKAVQQNVGGIGSTFGNLFAKIKLGWRGLVDLFKHGALSKGVTEELQKADMQGVGAFLTSMAQKIDNLKALFRGVSEGFRDNLDRLMLPLGRLQGAFGRLFDIFLGGASDSSNKTDKWEQSGYALGDALVTISGNVIDLIANITDLGTEIGKTFKDVTFKDFADTVTTMANGFSAIVTAVAWLIDGLKTLGEVIGEGVGKKVQFIEGLLQTAKSFADPLNFFSTKEQKTAGRAIGIENIKAGWGFGGNEQGTRSIDTTGVDQAAIAARAAKMTQQSRDNMLAQKLAPLEKALQQNEQIISNYSSMMSRARELGGNVKQLGPNMMPDLLNRQKQLQDQIERIKSPTGKTLAEEATMKKAQEGYIKKAAKESKQHAKDAELARIASELSKFPKELAKVLKKQEFVLQLDGKDIKANIDQRNSDEADVMLGAAAPAR